MRELRWSLVLTADLAHRGHSGPCSGRSRPGRRIPAMALVADRSICRYAGGVGLMACTARSANCGLAIPGRAVPARREYLSAFGGCRSSRYSPFEPRQCRLTPHSR